MLAIRVRHVARFRRAAWDRRRDRSGCRQEGAPCAGQTLTADETTWAPLAGHRRIGQNRSLLRGRDGWKDAWAA